MTFSANQIANHQFLNKIFSRFTLSNQERRRPVRHGKSLSARIKDLISIVSNSTFCEWVRTLEDAPHKRPKPKDAKPGRPRVEESVSAAIIRIRKESSWRCTKIVQAMRRLGHSISRQTMKTCLWKQGWDQSLMTNPIAATTYDRDLREPLL